jgi:Flp pilus assembly protein TadG
MMKTLMSSAWLQMRLVAARLLEDSSGIAATEFAVIVPIMLVMFFGTVEFASGVAVDRKVTLIARTLADLTSQAAPTTQGVWYAPVSDTYLQNVFTASIVILTPYQSTPATAQLSEIYVDSNSVATIQWSRAATIATGATQATLTTSTRHPTDVVTSIVPASLLIKQTYLIFSEVSYLYTPVGIGYVMKANLTLKDVSYSRPRQATCLVYTSVSPNLPILVGPGNNLCPST